VAPKIQHPRPDPRPPTPRSRPADVATLLRKGLEVSDTVLPSIAFTKNGLTIAWMTSGPAAQELTYTVR
jgi:hypothetical protein